MEIMEFLTLCITVGALVVAAVKFVDAKLDPLIKELAENTKETRAIRTELFGYSGTNGMRSDIRELKADVKILTNRVGDLEHDGQ